jgi:large subunit ribosomal protein L35
MPKMKSHRGAAKRMKRTGSGKIMRHKAFNRHILTSKGPKRKRSLGRPVEITGTVAKTLSQMLPK